jgi:hypothetical protein
MSIDAKKQHYIWEFYLKGWASDGQLWCCREGNVFQSSTENVGQQRYFYGIESLTDAEIALLLGMIMRGPAINQFTNRSSLDTYLTIANSGNQWAKFGLEQYYGMIERNALPALQDLRGGNFNVLYDRQSKIHLCIYLGHQYTRTKKARASCIVNPEELTIPEDHINCDLNKVQNAMGFILANCIGGAICDHLDLKVVENHSNTNLLTSDQPIYNLLAIPGDISEDSSIYFPISPQLALWASKKPNEEKIDTDRKAQELNSFVAKNSLEFIFAASKDELKVFTT